MVSRRKERRLWFVEATEPRQLALDRNKASIAPASIPAMPATTTLVVFQTVGFVVLALAG